MAKKNEKKKAKAKSRSNRGVSKNDRNSIRTAQTSAKGKPSPKAGKSKIATSKREKEVLKSANTGRRQLRDGNGRFITKNATEAILKKVRNTRSKSINYKDFLSLPEIKGFIKTRVIKEPIPTTSLIPLIDNDNSIRHKYVVITIDGRQEQTVSKSEIKIVIHQENQKLYDIIEFIEDSDGEIDSPQCSAMVTTKETQDESYRHITIDYTSDKICPSIDSDTWRDFKDEYILSELEEDYEEQLQEERASRKAKARIAPRKKTKKNKGNTVHRKTKK